MRELTIAGRRIADDAPCYVIAEIGGNHGGSVDVAAQMIRTAAACGVDAVKFQRRTNPALYTSAILAKPYENEHSFGVTYGAHREALELTYDQLVSLVHVAHGAGVAFLCTAFDEQAVQDITDLECPAIKVHSGGVTDGPLLRAVAASRLPVLVSTGGSTLYTITAAARALADSPHALLHCTASYPLKPEEANLRVIGTLRQAFPQTVIGWSSHATGPALSLVAYALGARILEHHVTLDRASKGTDHAFSLEPGGLRWLMKELRKAYVAFGDGVKRFYVSEQAPIAKMRRVETPEGWKIAG